jgi:hypothetical protein
MTLSALMGQSIRGMIKVRRRHILGFMTRPAVGGCARVLSPGMTLETVRLNMPTCERKSGLLVVKGRGLPIDD